MAMVPRKHPHDHLLLAWNYLHVHWVRGLGLVPGLPKRRHCRDHHPRRRRRNFSTCSALTCRWEVAVMPLISFCSVVYTCTILIVTILLCRLYLERAKGVMTGSYVIIKILMNSFDGLDQFSYHKRRAHSTESSLLRICGPKERIDKRYGCAPPGSTVTGRLCRRRPRPEPYLEFIWRASDSDADGPGLRLTCGANVDSGRLDICWSCHAWV